MRCSGRPSREAWKVHWRTRTYASGGETVDCPVAVEYQTRSSCCRTGVFTHREGYSTRVVAGQAAAATEAAEAAQSGAVERAARTVKAVSTAARRMQSATADLQVRRILLRPCWWAWEAYSEKPVPGIG
jgi:hypothetical protein